MGLQLQRLLSFGGPAGAALRLEQDLVRIGRAADNDVVFDGEQDRQASSYHAEVRREGGCWLLVDLDSKNGTWVQGRRIRRHAIESGDEVTFGSRGPMVRLLLDGEDLASARSRAPAAGSVPISPTEPDLEAGVVGPRSVAAGPVSAAAAPRSVGAGAPASAIPLAPLAGARPGKRTIAEMISEAVRAAPRPPVHGAAVAAAVRSRTRWLVAVLGVSLVCIALLVVWSIKSQRAIDRLSDDVASVPHPSNAPKSEGTKAARESSFSRRIYDANRKGIFMLAADGHGFCTAFAVRPSVLATNAHCVRGAQQHHADVVALENEGHGKTSFRVTSMKAHPSFRDRQSETITPDVGIIRIAGKVATVLELATPQELTRTGAGDEVYLIGFPGRLMNAQNPAATFMAAHVGRVTDGQGQPSSFARAWLVEHDAQTTGGTSGSPVFDGYGKVIAINAGTYVQQDENQGAQASPYKYAMRIDLLNSLLQ